MSGLARALPAIAALAALLGAIPAAWSDNAPSNLTGPTPAPGTSQWQSSGLFGFTAGLDRSGTLFGDLWGLRPMLSQVGITLNLQETSEVLGNVSGGTHRGAAYDGLTQMQLQLDTQRAFGMSGGTFNVSALQIHGRNLSADNLQSLQTASGIEADRATRLWELWYQQKFLDEDRLDIKVGQQSLDQEFMVSQNALLFVNTMFGWPMLPSADLPGGGPAYPLSALGVRARLRPTDSWTLLAGAFSGSPAPDDTGDPQQRNPSGTSFSLNRGVLAIAELQYAYPSLNTMVTPDEGEPLARVYKIGAWYDSERFADQRFDSSGLPLASPASNGIPASHRGDYAIYAVADQMIWRDKAEADHNASVFLRLMGTPLADRNLISFSANAGLTLHEPFAHRDDDTFGLGLGYTSVSSAASALSRDIGANGPGYYPHRGSETFVEATYQYQVAPWWQLQPDVQYVFHPGGGVPNPVSGQRIKNELVLGLRTNILM